MLVVVLLLPGSLGLVGSLVLRHLSLVSVV